MKSELMSLFGDQLCWFIRLERKQRFCVLYFCLKFWGSTLCLFHSSTTGASCSVELWKFRAVAEEACSVE